MKRKSSRYEVQPWPSASSFELLFEPLYAVGPEESGKRISAYELMLRREYRLALEGNLASQKVIMRVLRSNERARAVRDRRGSRIAYEEYRYPPCDYEAVLCLLGIAVRLNGPERYEIDSLGQYVPDLIRRADDPTLRLNPWAFDLAAQRLKLVDEEKRDWLEKRVMPAGEECDSPVIIEPDPPRRDPKDTRFQKGKSGNPKPRHEVMRLRQGSYAGRIPEVLGGSWRAHTRRTIRSSGYVIDSLEAALWCTARTSSFAEAVLLAANLGEDSDTVAAITGQLAGSLYGREGIPARWLETLAWSHQIETMALELTTPAGWYPL